MDVFIESIVAKKKSFYDLILVVGICLGAVVLIFILSLLSSVITILKPLLLFLVCGAIYLCYFFITGLNLEYEYAITNSELDIDTIIARRKRKRIFSGSIKDFELFAKVNSEYYTEQIKSIKKSIQCVSTMESDNVYFAVVHYKSEKTVLYIEPNEKMLRTIKTIIPRNSQITLDKTN